MSKDWSVDTMSKDWSMDTMTKDWSVDTMSKDRSMDTMSKDRSMDTMTKDWSVDSMGQTMTEEGSSTGPGNESGDASEDLEKMLLTRADCLPYLPSCCCLDCSNRLIETQTSGAAL